MGCLENRIEKIKILTPSVKVKLLRGELFLVAYVWVYLKTMIEAARVKPSFWRVGGACDLAGFALLPVCSQVDSVE